MSSTDLIEHLLLGLVVVFGLMAVLARLVRRGRGGLLRGGRRAPAIETLARVSLNKATSVAVLRVGQRELLVGVGAGSVSVLAETPVGVLTGTAPVTIDVSETDGVPALTAAASNGRAMSAGTSRASSTALATMAHSAAAPLPAGTRPGAGVGEPWWPTFVEQLRSRTARTTTRGTRVQQQ